MKKVITQVIARQFPELQKEDGSINHNALARLSGIPQPTITRLLNGQIKDPSSQTVDQLAEALQISPAQLRGYHSLAAPTSISVRESSKRYTTRIIFGLSMTEAAEFAQQLPKLSKNHEEKIHVQADAPYSPLSFFIRVKDKANEPEIHLHDLIILDPKAIPKPGDFVLAKTKEQGLVIRRFTQKSPKIYQLQAINEHFPTYEMNADPLRKNILATLVELRREVKN